MQSYSWNVKYLLPRWVHLVRLAANRINLWFPFHLLSHFLPGWVSCKSVELTPLFCFVSGSGICLCFIFPLPLNKKSKPVCLRESIDCAENAGLCCKGAQAAMLSLSGAGSHQKAHGVPWRSCSSTTKADFSLWIRQTTQKATIASINTI